MINSLNTANFLRLDSDIRTSSTNTFDAKEAFENVFEDVVSDIATQETQKENKINFSNLGAPPGFILDTSLYDERIAMEALKVQ